MNSSPWRSLSRPLPTGPSHRTRPSKPGTNIGTLEHLIDRVRVMEATPPRPVKTLKDRPPEEAERIKAELLAREKARREDPVRQLAAKLGRADKASRRRR